MNPNLMPFLNQAAATGLAAVLNAFWASLALTAMVALLLRRATRLNAATRYWIWWAVLGAIVAMPLAPAIHLAPRHVVAPAAALPAAPGASPNAAAPVSATAMPAAQPIVAIPQARVSWWPLALLGIWLAWLVFVLARTAASWHFLRGLKRRAFPADLPLPAGDGRRTRLLISRELESPAAVGYVPPAILLPEGLAARLEAPELEQVLLHEQAHLARRDDWLNLGGQMTRAVLGLHPLAWFALRNLEREREMACDDFVVARTGSARPYARCLVRLFELRGRRPETLLASGIFENGSRLGERVEQLLRAGRRFPARVSRPALAAACLALGLLALAAAALPHWFAITPRTVPPARQAQSRRVSPAEARAFMLRLNAVYRERQLQLQRSDLGNLPTFDAASVRPFDPSGARAAAGSLAPQREALSAMDAKWLNEDVAYIITPQERAQFEALQTEAARKQFIEAFWAKRNPTPGSAYNSFEEEHYRRIAYANEYFSAANLPGWKSDRGRIYIEYGKPDELDHHDVGADPAYEVWTYDHLQDVGDHIQFKFVDACRCGVYGYSQPGQ